jgi:hypothetical protein
MLQRDFATKNNNWLNFRTREGGKINLKTMHVLWQLIEIANRNNSDLIEMSLTGLIEEAFNGTCSFNQLVLHLTALESIGAIDRISAGVRRKGAIKINFERIKMLEVNQMKMERA